MNHPAPSYLLPNILIGSIAVVAAVLFGIRRAIIHAGLPVRDRSRTFWSTSALRSSPRDPTSRWFRASGFFRLTPSTVSTKGSKTKRADR
jgi:hypothetical protein